jgi:hypothetical protein
MSNPETRLKAERSLAFAEACEKCAETPAEMYMVLRLEKRAMAKLTKANHFALAALGVEPLSPQPSDERRSYGAGMTTTTWHRMGLPLVQPLSSPPLNQLSAETRRTQQADPQSITPAAVGKVLGHGLGTFTPSRADAASSSATPPSRH